MITLLITGMNSELNPLNTIVFNELTILGPDLVLPVDKKILEHMSNINEIRKELLRYNFNNPKWDNIMINLIYQIKNLSFFVEE